MHRSTSSIPCLLRAMTTVVLLCTANVAIAETRPQAGDRPGASTIRVELLDETNSFIQGARVFLTTSDGGEIDATYEGNGVYLFLNAVPGIYIGRIEASGFVTFEDDVVLVEGEDRTESIVLRVEREREQINVDSDIPPGAAPEFRGGVRILRGRALGWLIKTQGPFMRAHPTRAGAGQPSR